MQQSDQRNPEECFKFTSVALNTLRKGESSTTHTFTLEDLTKRDVLGRSILHLLAILNDTSSLAQILKLLNRTNNYHYLLTDDLENNWNVLHYAIYYFNFAFVRALLGSNIPVLTKLVNQKDKNGLTPYDLLHSFETKFRSSRNIPFSIDTNGAYDSTTIPKCTELNTQAWTHSSSFIISVPSGEFSNVEMSGDVLFPPPSNNPLLHFRISKMFSTSTHSILITSDGRLYISNPSPMLVSSSFCRIKFFDDLYQKGEKVIDASLNCGHTVVITSFNRAYAFGQDFKRLNLYLVSPSPTSPASSTSANSPFSSITPPASSSSQDTPYAKDLNSLIPLQVSIKHNSSFSGGISTLSSSSSKAVTTNNFSALASIPSSALASDEPETSSSKDIIGVSSSNNHTVIYSKTSLHMHGLNVGQFGPLINAIYSSTSISDKGTSSSSTSVSSAHFLWKYAEDPIHQVLALDLTTVVVTSSSMIHFYISNMHISVTPSFNNTTKDNWSIFRPRILSTPKKIVKVIIPSANDSKSSSAGNLNSNDLVLLLLESGEVYVMSFPRYTTSKDSFKDGVKFSLLWKPSRVEMNAVDVSVGELSSANATGAVLCTRSGEAFKKTKSKWVRINDITRVTNVQIGFGFHIYGEFSAFDDSKTKIMFLRQEENSLKHKFEAPSIITDIGMYSPLAKFRDLSFTKFSDNAPSIDFFENGDLASHEDEDDHDEGSFGRDRRNGILFFKHQPPMTFNSKKSEMSYVFISEESFITSMLLDGQEINAAPKPNNELNFEKYYDYELTVKNTTTDLEMTFNVHKTFIFSRLGIESATYELNRKNLVFAFDEDGGKIIGEIDVRSVGLFLHMLYTDEVIDLWNFDKSLDSEIKAGWDRLQFAFPMVKYMDAVRTAFVNDGIERDALNSKGDVTIKLKDGEFVTWKYLLIARCDYFKHLFGQHWNSTYEVNFHHVTEKTWSLVMNYILGDSNDELFYESVEELVESNITHIQHKINYRNRSRKWESDIETPLSVDDFINTVLDVLYLSNELLLPNLRRNCELAIKDLINFENYDILLQHAYLTGSKQLFADCAWYILNNLPLCYKDARLNTSILGEQCIVELEQKIHELVGIYFPNRESKAERPGFVALKKKASSIEKQHIKNAVASFTSDIDKFNAFYLHPYLHEAYGITDEQIDVHISMTRRRKSNANTVKGQDQSQGLNNERSNSNSFQSLKDLSDIRKQSITSDENAITDTPSDEFFVVQKGRRKSSYSARRPSVVQIGNNPAVAAASTPPRYEPTPFRSTTWKISSDVMQGSSTSNIGIGTSSRSNSDTPTPTPTTSTTAIDEMLQQSKTTASKKPKFKIRAKSMTPLNIKDEKSSTSTKDVESKKTPWKLGNTWGVNTPQVISEPSTISSPNPPLNSVNVVNGNGSSKSTLKVPASYALNTASIIAPKKLGASYFPSLEELKRAKSTASVANSYNTSVPLVGSSSASASESDYASAFGYADFEERTSSSNTVKSLEDIKAEEEFAKWWAEETKRVQREMGGNDNDGAKQNEGRQNAKGGGRGGRGRGRGNARGRGRGQGRDRGRANGNANSDANASL